MARRPFFHCDEEEATAKWLSEIAERGFGLKPEEFLDFCGKCGEERK